MKITQLFFWMAVTSMISRTAAIAQAENKTTNLDYSIGSGQGSDFISMPLLGMFGVSENPEWISSPKKRSGSREYPETYLRKNLSKFQSMKSGGRNMIIIGVPAMVGGAVLFADGMTHSDKSPYEEDGDAAKILGGMVLMVVGETMIIGGIVLYAFGNKRVNIYRRLLKEKGIEVSAGFNRRGICLTWHF